MILKEKMVVKMTDGINHIVQKVKNIKGKEVALLLSLEDFVLRFAIEDENSEGAGLKFQTDKEKILKIAEEFDKV